MRLRTWVLIASVAAMLGMAACNSDDSGEPGDSGSPGGGADARSVEGQVAYACALAEHVRAERGEPATWTTFVGDRADPGAVEAAAVGSLLGGSAAYTLEDHADLSEAGGDVFQAVSRVDPAALETALGEVEEGCVDVDTGSPDVSEEGRVGFACDLAKAVVDEHGDWDTWGGLGEDPVWHQVASIGALVGGANGYAVPGSEELSDRGKDLISGISRADGEAIDQALDGFVDAC